MCVRYEKTDILNEYRLYPARSALGFLKKKEHERLEIQTELKVGVDLLRKIRVPG